MEKLWVVHGDQFDGVIKHAKWLAYLGDRGYAILIRLNNTLNKIRKPIYLIGLFHNL